MFLNHFKNYLTGNFVAIIVPFLVIPVVTRKLEVEEYALFGLYIALQKLLSIIVDLGGNSAIQRFYFSNEKASNLVSVKIILSLFIVSIAFIVITAAYSSIAQVINIELNLIYLALFCAFCSVLIETRRTNFLVREQSKQFSIFFSSESIFSGIIILILLIIFDLSFIGRVLSEFITLTLFMVISLILLWRDGLLHVAKIEIKTLKNIFSYGVSLIPHTLSIFCLSFLDRFILSNYLELAEVGIYILAFQIAMILGLFIDALNRSYIPWLFKSLENKKSISFKSKHFSTLAVILFPIALVSFLIDGNLFAYIFGDQYSRVSEIFPYFVIAQCLSGLYIYQTNFLLFYRKNSILSSITIFAAILHVFFLLIFVEKYGFYAAPYALIISMSIRLCLTYYFAAKLVNDNYGMKNVT